MDLRLSITIPIISRKVQHSTIKDILWREPVHPPFMIENGAVTAGFFSLDCCKSEKDFVYWLEELERMVIVSEQ